MKIYSPQIIGTLEVDGNSTLTGSLEVTAGITGSLLGTASFAVSASFATNALSASFAPSTPTFPFTGSAVISGSLAVTGSTNIVGILNINDPTANANGINIGVIGQTRNFVPGNPSAPGMAIGYANGTTGTFNQHYIIGNNNVPSFQANGAASFIFGQNNAIGGNNNRGNVILGTNHSMPAESQFSIFAGGDSHQTSGSFNVLSYSGILAGFNNTIAHSQSVILGGANITTTAHNTTFVPNLNVSGSSTFRNNIEVTGSVNIRNGAYNIATGSLSGSAVDNISNITGSTQVQHIAFATQAQYDAITPDANTLYFISGSGNVVEDLTVTGSLLVSGSSVFTGSIVGNVSALSIASNTASLDLNTGNFFTLQLVSGSNTFINPTNIKAGQTINLRVNTTGSATVSFPSSVKQVSGSLYVPTTTTGVDIVTFISFDTGSLFLSNVKNLV